MSLLRIQLQVYNKNVLNYRELIELQRDPSFYGGASSLYSAIQPFFFLLLITPSRQGNEKLDFDFYLWMAVPDTRAVSQDINLDKCAFFSLIYCLQVYLSGSLLCCESVIFRAPPLKFCFD